MLVVTCPACHKAYWVAPYVLHERFHEHLPLEVVAKEFVCKRCGNKRDMSWRIGELRWILERHPTYSDAVREAALACGDSAIRM